jgi:hypothetical protein
MPQSPTSFVRRWFLNRNTDRIISSVYFQREYFLFCVHFPSIKLSGFFTDKSSDQTWNHWWTLFRRMYSVGEFIDKNFTDRTVILHRQNFTMLFWWHCFPSSSPRHAKAGEEGFSSPPLQILCLSLSLSPLQTQKQLTDPHFSHGLPLRWKNKGDKLADGPREAAQWPLSHPTHSAWLDKGRMALSIFPFYKYSLTRQWGGGGEDERREYERT